MLHPHSARAEKYFPKGARVKQLKWNSELLQIYFRALRGKLVSCLFNKTLPKSFQYSYQIGFIHIEKITIILSIRKKEVWCQRKTMWISIWRTQAILCEACAGYVEAGGLYRKPSAVNTKKYKGKNLSTAQMRDVTWGKTQLKNNRNRKSSFYTCNKWVFSCK